MRKLFQSIALLALLLPTAVEAYTYAAALKTARMQTTASRFDDGSLEVLHSDGTTVCATWTLGSQAAAVSGSVWTVAFSATTVSASATCTATSARMKRSAGNGSAIEISAITVGTVAAGTAELRFDNTNWVSGQSITITALTFTHA